MSMNVFRQERKNLIRALHNGAAEHKYFRVKSMDQSDGARCPHSKATISDCDRGRITAVAATE
jgi:hypothetical protein